MIRSVTVVAGEHSRDLTNPFVALERAHRGRGDAVARRVFSIDEVMVGLCRHRGQVRDGKHLLMAPHFGKALADLLGHLTPEAGVDLVEDRHDVLVHRLERQREKHATQLPAAGERRERSLGLSGVRREEYLGLRSVVAVDDEAQTSRGRAPRASSGARPRVVSGAAARLTRARLRWRADNSSALERTDLLVKVEPAFAFVGEIAETRSQLVTASRGPVRACRRTF